MMRSGIRSLDDLKDRCRIDEETGCWIWAGAANADGQATVWVPALRKTTSLGSAISLLTTGRPTRGGLFMRPVCGRKLCANPEHRQLATQSTAMRAARPTLDPLHRAKISASMRARSRLKPEDVEAIRASDATDVALGERFRVDNTTISNIRCGRTWRDSSGASVFNWRPI